MQEMSKVSELTLNVSARRRRKMVTNTAFFSQDVGTGRKVIHFRLDDQPLSLTGATVVMGFEFVADQQSKIIDSVEGSIVIENAARGRCRVTLPNHLVQYEGEVLVHVYVKYADGRSLDCGVIATEFAQSWLDRELPEMETFYVKRFEDLAREIRARADRLHDLLSEVDTQIIGRDEFEGHVEDTFLHLQQIEPREAAASIDTYPIGRSVFSIGDETPDFGFPTSNALVETIKLSDDRILQTCSSTRASRGGNPQDATWSRTGNAHFTTEGHWGAWRSDGGSLRRNPVAVEWSWDNTNAIFDNMVNGEVRVLPSTDAPGGPFNSTQVQALLFRRAADSQGEGGAVRRWGYILAFRSAGVGGSSIFAIRQLNTSVWGPWVYPITTTTLSAPLFADFGDEQVEVCLNDVTEYLFGQMSGAEKEALALYVKNKLKQHDAAASGADADTFKEAGEA